MSASAETSRRALLLGAAGGVAALVAQALGRPLPTRAASGTFDSADPAIPAVSASHTNNVGGSPALGVLGQTASASGTGVKGLASWIFGLSTGVLGVSNSESGVGVRGTATSTTGGANGVWGETVAPGGAGVVGRNNASGASGAFANGVWGETAAEGGAGVVGKNTASGAGAQGVRGESASGIGGVFTGGSAQLKLVPKGTSGKPTSGTHEKGELYMDFKSNLFVCSVAGTPGTWKKVLTKLV